jgi:hypothetical protein
VTPTCPLPLGRILAGLATLLVVVAAPAAATAHEGPGVLTVETDQPTDAGRHYVVRLTWQNDGHPAARATTLTATAFGPDGAAQTPVPMTAVDDDGRFEATLALPEPGQWRVNFTSVTPRASVDVQATVAAPSTTSTADDAATSSSPSTTGSDAAATADDQAAGEEDGGSSGVAVLLVAVVLLAAIGTAAVLLVRRAAGDTSAGEGASPGGHGEPSATATEATSDAGAGQVADAASAAEPVDSSEASEADGGSADGAEADATTDANTTSDAGASRDAGGSGGQATST